MRVKTDIAASKHVYVLYIYSCRHENRSIDPLNAVFRHSDSSVERVNCRDVNFNNKYQIFIEKFKIVLKSISTNK